MFIKITVSLILGNRPSMSQWRTEKETIQLKHVELILLKCSKNTVEKKTVFEYIIDQTHT